METRYTGWGAKVSIKTPPASAVTTKLDPAKAQIQLPRPPSADPAQNLTSSPKSRPGRRPGSGPDVHPGRRRSG
ncbi:hypothetical protein SAMN05444920_101673 [Nonomuraea solani]|uniref:Uncharacterized protein n=2 Tax=Nonomuraea solani TaxID=1144553 RepID=A0A1H5UVN7_9ACTN|nr:hypothetical protein SAMN05444920_101673 [Nonomuraea solani]